MYAASTRASLSFEVFETAGDARWLADCRGIDSLGFGAQSGQINFTSPGQPADVDVYQYNAPVTQTLDLRAVAMGSLQSASLSIFSANGAILASSSGETGQQTTEVRFDVRRRHNVLHRRRRGSRERLERAVRAGFRRF